MLQDLILPKMGESITEATVLRWLVKEGDLIQQDQPVLEIATDKVDSEITAPMAGILSNIRFKENDVVPIGSVLAQINTSGDQSENNNVQFANSNNEESLELPDAVLEEIHEVPFVSLENSIIDHTDDIPVDLTSVQNVSRFYSPLVRTIAKQENITIAELDSIKGTGAEGRVSKEDVLNFLQTRNTKPDIAPLQINKPTPIHSGSSLGDEIIEMDRMRKLIADHMVMSKHTSAHVTSFIDVDVTNLVLWRNRVKNDFQKKNQQNLTFTPVFVDLAVKTIKDFPLINSSINGYQIVLKKNINIGMATALANGNLIVPVIKNADRMNLQGLAMAVNDLAARARDNKLKPEEVADGTFTITNLGAFQNTTGTPIINQPQVAILALGTIQKKPVVIETPQGDMIGIRHMMILSMSYDHRVIDGAMGGMFLKKMKDYIESFDTNTLV